MDNWIVVENVLASNPAAYGPYPHAIARKLYNYLADQPHSDPYSLHLIPLRETVDTEFDGRITHYIERTIDDAVDDWFDIRDNFNTTPIEELDL